MVEHYLDTVGVTGSNPVSRTISSPQCDDLCISSKSNASIVTLFCLDGLIQGQASDVVFADDDSCLFVKSEMSTSYWQPPDRLGVAAENRLRLDAYCAQVDFGPLPPEANSRFSHTFRDHLRNIDGAVFYFFDFESQ